MANSNDDNSDFTRRKDRLFAEYTAFFADDSRPEDTACRLQLDALENLLKGFKDDNMNNTYLQETCNFLSHPWSKLDPSLSSLLDWDKRSVLLERIEATASQNFAEFYTPDRFTPRVWAVFMSATTAELQDYLDRLQSKTDRDWSDFANVMYRLDDTVPTLLEAGLKKIREHGSKKQDLPETPPQYSATTTPLRGGKRTLVTTTELPKARRTSMNKSSPRGHGAPGDASATPLSATPLSATPLSATPLPATPLSASQKDKSTAGRSEASKYQTRKRDGAKCVIMKSGVGQIAHAFAYSAIKHKGRLDSPLDALASVYGPEKIAAIRAALGGNLDVPANMVYLNYVPHQLWDKVRLGFRPIERLFNHEGIVNGIRLRLFVFSKSKLHKEYLPKFQWKPSLVQDLSEIFEESDSSLDFLMVSSKTQRIIRNGYEFDITADDPKYAPNWDIYDLMWRLSLMGVILGAGEVPDQTVPEPKQDPDGQLAPISQEPETDAVIEAVIDRLEDIVNQSDGAKEDTAS
ncbi:integral membrane protein [Colletotrichum asianum]|uniref:Integral membrane protein n=1 Tax=Colletotrichum asianum TaxID=702518 RepID=A0A8H3ZNI6_9PEZI|nr:integral membrane protein [Colletotrichum asianum]